VENEMSCRSWRKELATWLEQAEAAGEPARIPPELAAHAALCRECAVRLRAAQKLLAMPASRAPEDLSERVWAAVASRREAARGAPAVGRWAAVAAAAVIAVAAGFVLARGTGAASEVVTVRLALEAPGARQVSVVGDWNGWEPASGRLVDSDGDGVWEGTVRLRRLREYRYQFLIDGDLWVADPRAALSIDDGFGGKSSVLQL
jgi:hypothetical protein